MSGLRMRLAAGGGALVLLLGLCAATQPAALAQASPGIWEISGHPLSPRPAKICVRELASLAQLQHRRSRCTRVVIRDLPTVSEIHYTCTGGGFGRSTMKLITPRSLRVETQGIDGSEPFNYIFQARRVGDCPVPQAVH